MPIQENNGITLNENFPDQASVSEGPNDIAYVGVAPDRDPSIALNTVIELTDENLTLLDPDDNNTSTIKQFAIQASKHTPGRLFGIVVENDTDTDVLKANIIGESVGRQHSGIGLLANADIQPTLVSSDMSQDIDVAQALGVAAKKKMAIAVVSGPSTTSSDAIAFRETLAGGDVGDNILIIDGMGLVFDGDEPVYLPSPMIALGALASRPLNTSPHGTPLIITDVDTNIAFNFIDPATEGNQLNVNRVNFMKLIGNQGFQIIGHHVASGEFYSHIGLSIILKRLVINFFSTRIGPNMTDAFVSNLVNQFNQQLYILQNRGIFPQGNISLNQQLNTASENGAGVLYLVIDIERYSPATHYVIEINYTNRAITIS